MIKLKFTPEIIDQLHHERTGHAHPRVRQRMEAVYLKALGLPNQEIGRIVRISQTTLREYLQMYQEGGIEALKDLNFHQPKSEMDDHQDMLRQEFDQQPPVTLQCPWCPARHHAAVGDGYQHQLHQRTVGGRLALSTDSFFCRLAYHPRFGQCPLSTLPVYQKEKA